MEEKIDELSAFFELKDSDIPIDYYSNHPFGEIYHELVISDIYPYISDEEHKDICRIIYNNNDIELLNLKVNLLYNKYSKYIKN